METGLTDAIRGYWPLAFAWANEFCADDAEERAIIIGVAQTFGQAFIAWVPVLILNVGKYAPRFHLGFSIMSGISVLEFANIFVLRYFVNRDKAEKLKHKSQAHETAADSSEYRVDSTTRSKDISYVKTSLDTGP